jgi:hypothetical protein
VFGPFPFCERRRRCQEVLGTGVGGAWQAIPVSLSRSLQGRGPVTQVDIRVGVTRFFWLVWGSAIVALMLMYGGVVYTSPELVVAWSLLFGSLVLLVGLFAIVAARLYFLVSEAPLLDVLRGRND